MKVLFDFKQMFKQMFKKYDPSRTNMFLQLSVTYIIATLFSFGTNAPILISYMVTLASIDDSSTRSSIDGDSVKSGYNN